MIFTNYVACYQTFTNCFRTISNAPAPTPTELVTEGQSTPTTSSVSASPLPSRPSSAGPPPRPASTPLIKKVKKASSIPSDDSFLEKELAKNSSLIAKAIESETKQDADGLFGQLLAEHLRHIPEGYKKDMLKLDLQRQIMEVKYAVSQNSFADQHAAVPHAVSKASNNYQNLLNASEWVTSSLNLCNE